MDRTPSSTAALKSYIYFAETQDGVYFGGGAEHFLLKGAGIYPLVSRLVSFLDGSRSIDAIRDSLPVKARSFFGVLVGELRARDMLRECEPSNDNVSAEEWRLYRDTLLYLRDRTADFASLFRAWRARTNVIIGGGLCAKALLRGLARTGAGQIHLLPETCAGADNKAELVRVLQEHRARDGAFTYRVIDDVASLDGDARLIYAGDQIETCAHSGLHFAGGFLKGQAIVAGNFGADGDAVLADIASRLAEGQAGAYSAVTAPSIIGNLLAFELLRADLAAFTNNPQLASADSSHFLHLSPGGEVTTHRLPKSGPPTDEPTFDLFDPLVGPFERLPALAGYRLPLPHARVRIRRPDGAATEEIIWGVKQTHAEHDVVLKAATRYAASPRMVAARSYEAWINLALAVAITDSPLFTAAVTKTVTLEHLEDAEAHFLARLARLYSAERPALTLISAAEWPAFMAEAKIGSITAGAISATAIEAICNALGQACSLMQLAETGRAPEPTLIAVRTPLESASNDSARAPGLSGDACIAHLAAAGFSARPVMFKDAAFSAAGIYIGAIELAPVVAAL